MKEVVVIIEPFDFEQKIYVFEDGTLKMQAGASMQDLPDRILKICRADQVFNVTLRGTVDFTQKIKEELKTIELVQYKSQTLNIELA